MSSQGYPACFDLYICFCDCLNFLAVAGEEVACELDCEGVIGDGYVRDNLEVICLMVSNVDIAQVVRQGPLVRHCIAGGEQIRDTVWSGCV